MSNRLSIFAPAKINLYLRVGEKLPDGYHRLETVFQAIDLFDQLVFDLKESHEKGKIIIQVSPGPQSHLIPTDKSNLAYRAAKLFFDKTKLSNQDLKITISKKIPVSGGLAGGSTNAAATLYALNYLLGEPLKQDDILLLCKELGSDVPFCYLGGCMLGTGRGDQLTRLTVARELVFVVVFPPADQELSTKDVYATFDTIEARGHNEVNIEKFVEALLTKGEISKLMYNSLEEAAVSLSYWVDRAKSTLDANGYSSLVSGSGPTVFTVAPNEHQAHSLIKKLEKEGLRAGIHRAIDNSFQVIAH